MCFLVAVYTITSIVFLLQVNQYTQDIYDFPYLVSSQARIMKSRLYDFRSLTPVLFSSKDLNSAQLESALKTQEALQQQSITIIEDRYRGSPEELQELKDALKNIGQRRRELVELTREDPTVENVIKRYNQIVEPAFIHFDDILDRIASNADQRGSDINDKFRSEHLWVCDRDDHHGHPAPLVYLYRLERPKPCICQRAQAR